MNSTPAIRAALYAETGAAYTDRDADVSDMALSSVWGPTEDAEVPAERLALLGGIWDGAHCTIPELIRDVQPDADRICAVFWDPAAHRAGLVRRAAGMPAVCGRDGGGDSGCKRTITKTKPVE